MVAYESPVAAHALVARLVAQEEERLAWLRGFVEQADGLSSSALDGTVPSLSPLWAWISDWHARGLPGPDVDYVPVMASVDPTVGPRFAAAPPEVRRSATVAEAVGHSIEQALRSVDPSFRWAPYVTDNPVPPPGAGEPQVVSASH